MQMRVNQLIRKYGHKLTAMLLRLLGLVGMLLFALVMAGLTAGVAVVVVVEGVISGHHQPGNGSWLRLR